MNKPETIAMSPRVAKQAKRDAERKAIDERLSTCSRGRTFRTYILAGVYAGIRKALAPTGKPIEIELMRPVRKFIRNTSKYTPHQSKRECARRLRQCAA